MTEIPKAEFDGEAYNHEDDFSRLTGQIRRVYNVMIDGTWRTLGEIEFVTGDPQASISAQLRHLRKVKFGEFKVHKRRRGERTQGLFEYTLHKGDCKCELCFPFTLTG